MAELYAASSVELAFEAAKKAGEYALRGQVSDVHCVDAALTALREVNALTRHSHEPNPVFSAAPQTAEEAGNALVSLAGEYQSQPVRAAGDEAELSPAVVTLLLQAALYLRYLWNFFGG